MSQKNKTQWIKEQNTVKAKQEQILVVAVCVAVSGIFSQGNGMIPNGTLPGYGHGHNSDNNFNNIRQTVSSDNVLSMGKFWNVFSFPISVCVCVCVCLQVLSVHVSVVYVFRVCACLWYTFSECVCVVYVFWVCVSDTCVQSMCVCGICVLSVCVVCV